MTISTWKIAHSQEPSNQLLGFSGGFSYFQIVVHCGWVGGWGAKQMDLIYLSLPSEGCDIFQETRNYIIACIYIKSGKLVSS